MNVPDWWAVILLALAAFRMFKLLAEDDILDRPRRYVTRLGSWRKDGDALPIDYRMGLAKFLSCPWCLGAHVSVAWWMFWTFWPHGTLIAAAPFAISCLVGFAGHLMDE